MANNKAHKLTVWLFFPTEDVELVRAGASPVEVGLVLFTVSSLTTT